MKESTWLWIFAGIAAYYLLKSSQPPLFVGPQNQGPDMNRGNPNQGTTIDPLTGQPYTAPGWQTQIDPGTGMYANPLADPCYGNSPVYNLAQCQAQGRSGYASLMPPGSA